VTHPSYRHSRPFKELPAGQNPLRKELSRKTVPNLLQENEFAFRKWAVQVLLVGESDAFQDSGLIAGILDGQLDHTICIGLNA
jgi:hypothetical protein